MMNKVSECYKTFDKKHLEEIDTLESIKSSKNKRLNKNYFSFFIGETSRTGPFSVILRFQQSLSPSSTFNNSEIFLGIVVLNEPPVTTIFVSALIFMFIPLNLPFFCIYICNFTLYKSILLSLYKKGNIYITLTITYVHEYATKSITRCL